MAPGRSEVLKFYWGYGWTLRVTVHVELEGVGAAPMCIIAHRREMCEPASVQASRLGQAQQAVLEAAGP